MYNATQRNHLNDPVLHICGKKISLMCSNGLSRTDRILKRTFHEPTSSGIHTYNPPLGCYRCVTTQLNVTPSNCHALFWSCSENSLQTSAKTSSSCRSHHLRHFRHHGSFDRGIPVNHSIPEITAQEECTSA